MFSGSLYALALTNVKVLGAVTPIGGLLFLAGWAMLGSAGSSRERTARTQTHTRGRSCLTEERRP